MRRRRRLRIPPSVFTVAGLLGIWWLAPTILHVPEYQLPSIGAVVGTARRLAADGTLLHHAVASLTRLFLALVVGGSLGVAAGLALATSARLTRFFEPLLLFFQAMAGIAWVPLAIIWFGIGAGPVLFVVANLAFFIMFFTTAVGVQTIPRVMRSAVQTLGGGSWAVLREVLIPGALAQVLGGLRLAVGYGWRSLVAAEIIAGGDGLGYLAGFSGQIYDSAGVVVAILTIGFCGVAIESLIVRPIERRTVVRWGMVRPS